MWYKFNIETNEWYFGNEVHFPNGIILKDNKEETIDGFVWYNEPPQEYLDWLENNSNI